MTFNRILQNFLYVCYRESYVVFKYSCTLMSNRTTLKSLRDFKSTEFSILFRFRDILFFLVFVISYLTFVRLSILYSFFVRSFIILFRTSFLKRKSSLSRLKLIYVLYFSNMKFILRNV